MDKKYSLKELFNNLKNLSNIITCNLLSPNYTDIILSGSINNIRNYYFNRYFYIQNDNINLKCYCSKNNFNIINQLEENKFFTFKGNLSLSKNNFNNHINYELLFNVNEILYNKNDISYMDKLIMKCKELNLFDNKKSINWFKVKNIALLSRQGTHGYNDFITLLNKFNNPINIKLFDIILEGEQTETSLINSINNINTYDNIDIILILRGGGNTNNISLSFDKLDIFNCIKQSNIPVCSAIGHSDDTDNKLLITKITDYDFITPTEAGNFLNNIYLKKLNNKLNSYNKQFNNFIKFIINELNNIFDKYNEDILFLNNFIENKNNKFINITNDNNILICNNKYYRLDLSKLEKIKFDNINNLIINSLNQINNKYSILPIDDNFLNFVSNNINIYNYCLNLYKIYYNTNDNIFIIKDLFDNLNNNDNIDDKYNLLIQNNLINNEIIKIYNKIKNINNIIDNNRIV